MEDVGQVSQIENVMEFQRSRHKHLRILRYYYDQDWIEAITVNLGYFGMQLKRGMHDIGAHLPDKERKLVAGMIQVVRQNSVVDGVKRILEKRTSISKLKCTLIGLRHPNLAWKADGKGGKMPLKSWIDGKATSSRIHTRNVLTVVDVLWSQLVSIIPMIFE